MSCRQPVCESREPILLCILCFLYDRKTTALVVILPTINSNKEMEHCENSTMISEGVLLRSFNKYLYRFEDAGLRLEQ